jgi:hypothetical protein
MAEGYSDEKIDTVDPSQLLQAIESLQRAVTNIGIDQETINSRLKRIEGQDPRNDGSSSGNRDPPLGRHSQNRIIPFQAESDSQSNDVQREYECLKDSLVKVKLPNEVKLLENKTGIKREDQPHLLTISKSARYTETCLKLISTFKDNPSVDDISQLYTVLVAHINCLQSEYTSLLVKGQFDKDTASLFKCLERNTTQFTPDSLENLKTAAEITAIKGRVKTDNSNRGYSRGRGYTNYRRFGGFRRGGFGYGGSRGFAPGSEIPKDRDDQD